MCTHQKVCANANDWLLQSCIHPIKNFTFFLQIKSKIIYLRNIQLQRAYKKNDLTATDVIKRSTDWQLWIMARDYKTRFLIINISEKMHVTQTI